MPGITDATNFVITTDVSNNLQAKPKRYRQVAFKLGLLFTSICLTLIACEVVLRIVSPGYSPLFLDIYRMDQSGVLTLRPNIERRHLTNEFDVKVATNSDGLRDWPNAVSDKNGRVVGVGDSMAFGWGVELDQSIYALTEQALRSNEIRIVKAGIPATGTIDQFRWLQEYGDTYKPRAVVVSFTVFNDFTDNLAGGVSERFTVRDGLMVWFKKSDETGVTVSSLLWEGKEKIKRSSLLAQKAAQVWWYFDTKIVNPEDRTNPALNTKGSLWENGQIYLKQSSPETERAVAATLKSLDDIQQWCEERKIPLVLFVIPHGMQLYEDELSRWQNAYKVSSANLDLDRPQRILSEWAAKKKATVVDLLPYFRAYQSVHPNERLYFYPDSHMNANGHRVAAGVLQEALKTALRIPDSNASAASTPSGNNIVLDPATRYQTFIGWEATAQGGQTDFPDWNLYKNNLMDQAVADGINRIRLELQITTERPAPSPTTPVNDNADPFVINPAGFQWKDLDGQVEIVTMMKSRLAARGEPPPYVVLCYVDFNPSTLHTVPQEYAELMEAAFIHLRSTYGWVPDAVEALLEADNQTSPDPIWNPAMVGNSIVAAQARLARHGWNPRWIALSTTACQNAASWYNAMKAKVPASIQYVDELSYHRYGGCSQSDVDGILAAARADGKWTSMLELIGANYINLHQDLKAGNIAWQQYTLGYDAANGDGGGAYYLVNHTNHMVTISARMKMLRQYFKYIRRGAVRIAANSNKAALDPVAFINTNGKYVVVVKATGDGGSFNVLGLPAGSYGLKYTTATRYDFDLPNQTINAGGIVATNIPEAGVITIYAT